MNNRNKLFRQESLEKLASPERLDELMHLTSPKNWIALGGIGALLLFAVSWGIFGNIYSKAKGIGVLIRPKSLVEVHASGSGRVITVRVKPGDEVLKGDVIATIDQPELALQIEHARAEVRVLENQYKALTTFNEQDLILRRDYLQNKRQDINDVLQILNRRLESYRERIISDEQLYAKGLITRQNLDETREEYAKTQQEIESQSILQKEINLELLALANNKAQQKEQLIAQIGSAERKVKQLENQMILNSQIISPYDGRILEIQTNAGQLIEHGSTIVTIEHKIAKKQKIIAQCYLTATEGKKIKTDMPCHVEVATVKVEEYGYINGKVISVGEFPTTKETMINLLGNKQLVEEIMASGTSLIAVGIELKEDPESYSGYDWTSSAGPHQKIYAGTFCKAAIIIEKRSPISLVLPFLKKQLEWS